MTEYEKLITAEQIAHTVEITECLTGKTGMANTCAGRVALFYGAEDGNDDKIVTPRTFSRQFKITAAILGLGSRPSHENRRKMRLNLRHVLRPHTGKFAGTGPVFYFSARLISFFAYSTVYTLPPDGLFR